MWVKQRSIGRQGTPLSILAAFAAMAAAISGLGGGLPAFAQATSSRAPASAPDAPQANGDTASEVAATADIDDLLNMDLETLSKVSVLQATDTNPIVEAVSRKAETLAESPGVVEVITAEQIRGFGAKTLRDVLARATSIWTPNSAFYPNNVLSIRGDLPGHYDTHVLLLLNGRPFKDTMQGGVDHPVYAAFPIESLDRIEIIRGPGSVLYGTNAFAGVVNLITKNPVESPDSLSALAGSMSTQRYETPATPSATLIGSHWRRTSRTTSSTPSSGPLLPIPFHSTAPRTITLSSPSIDWRSRRT